MIRLLDKNEIEGATQGLKPVVNLEFDDKTIQVYVYAAGSLIFDLRELTWEMCRECGVIVTGEKIVTALETLFHDSIRYMMKDIQKDLASIYGDAAKEIEEDAWQEATLEPDESECWIHHCGTLQKMAIGQDWIGVASPRAEEARTSSILYGA